MVDSVAVQDASGRVVLEVARPTGRPRLPMGPRTRTLDWMVIIFYFRQGAAQELLGRFNSLTMCHGLLANPCRWRFSHGLASNPWHTFRCSLVLQRKLAQ